MHVCLVLDLTLLFLLLLSLTQLTAFTLPTWRFTKSQDVNDSCPSSSERLGIFSSWKWCDLLKRYWRFLTSGWPFCLEQWRPQPLNSVQSWQMHRLATWGTSVLMKTEERYHIDILLCYSGYMHDFICFQWLNDSFDLFCFYAADHCVSHRTHFHIIQK